MIVPMKHVTILCVAGDKQKALRKLSALNVLHVETTITDSKRIARAKASVELATRAKSVISEALSAEWHALSLPHAAKDDRHEPNELIGRINTLADAYIAAKESLRHVELEILKYKPWGDFDPQTVHKLADEGIGVALFKLPPKVKIAPPAHGVVEILSADKSGTFGVAIATDIPEGAEKVPMPKEQLTAVAARRDRLLGEMQNFAKDLCAAKTELEKIDHEIALRKQKEDYVLVHDNMPEADVVAHISGFIDARKADALVAASKEYAWGVEIRDPADGEIVPTLLEPPKLFRPITALFGALGIFPGYHESDVSVVFYIFFSIFFAMLVGDAGYGALLLVASIVIHGNLRRKNPGGLAPAMHSVFTLAYVFSGATIVWGVLTGTYFGIDQKFIPAALQFKSIAFFADQDNIMQFCFTLGVLQLSIARIWNAIALLPSKKALAELGWAGIIWCMYCIVCGIVISGFVQPSWVVPVMTVSILLVLFFMLDRSELKTEGINLGMLPLNIISSMGDIISYVRLFAVGLASVQLAESFNTMAVEFALPLALKIPVVLLILLLGHGMNLAMAALSVLVHAVRLNTLEFSGTKGVSWSGVAFKPFQSKLTESELASEQHS